MKVVAVPRALRERHKLPEGSHELGHWKLTINNVKEEGKPPQKYFLLWHYSTLMLEWTEIESKQGKWSNIQVTHWSTGHGSVTDQQTMNVVFRELDIHWYFSRKGGASIVPITDTSVPKYMEGKLHGA